MQVHQDSIETTRYGTVLVNVFEVDRGWVAQVANENPSHVPSPDTDGEPIPQSRADAVEQLRQALERES